MDGGDVSTGEVVDLTDLDGSACADALASSQASLVDAERLQVELVAHWCDLHSTVRRGRADSAGPGRGQERLVSVAGDGTPRVAEFAAAELGLLLGMSTTGAQGLTRDVLGLRHRHPRLWALVRAGRARFFQARHVARATLAAGLDLAQARWVDDRVAPFLGQISWGRVLGLVEAAVIEADLEGAEQRRVAAEMARFVRTGRSNEFGTMTIYAKARAGDAIFFLAMCDRIAQILKLRRSLEVAGHADRCPKDPSGPDAQVEIDVLRSEAIGILASPVRALALLQWAEAHTTDNPGSADGADGTHSAGSADGDPTSAVDPRVGHRPLRRTAWSTPGWTGAPADQRQTAPEPPLPEPERPQQGHPALKPPGWQPGEPGGWQPASKPPDQELESSGQWQLASEPPEWEPEEPEHACPPPVVLDPSLDPDRFRPRAVLYVHVSQESFRRQSRGAARVEGVGPVTLEQAVDFLHTCQVTIRPVLDLNANPSADGYEVSPRVRETLVLRHPVETFPHGTLASRHADADHIHPYQQPPPAGAGAAGAAEPVPQTTADNLQPLGRLHHRLKTHGGWSCTSPEPGVALWRSPHGHWTRVDTTGTTYIGRLEGAPVLTQVVDAHHALLTGTPAQ